MTVTYRPLPVATPFDDAVLLDNEVTTPDAPRGDRAPSATPIRVGAPYVLGLYSSGGGGHISALDSVEACLQNVIDVRRVAPLREMLQDIDPVARITAGRFDGERLFNALAERGNIGLLNILEKFGTRRVRTHRVAMAQRIRDAISEHPPTLIVSTMPFINAAVSDVAADMGIPFIVVPTDYDLTNFVAGLPDPMPAGQHVVHAFWEQAAQFPGTCVGYPLRPHLCRPITPLQHRDLRHDAGIPQDRRVIVIMVGSAGGVRALDIAKHLADDGEDKNYHLVICCGRNKQLLRRALAWRHPGVTIDVRGYTTDMVSLFGMADVLITKPGGGTVMEALALGVPMVIDHAKACVPWEQGNLDLARDKGAAVMEETAQVAHVVDAVLAQKREFASAAGFSDFQNRFRALVASCLPTS